MEVITVFCFLYNFLYFLIVYTFALRVRILLVSYLISPSQKNLNPFTLALEHLPLMLQIWSKLVEFVVLQKVTLPFGTRCQFWSKLIDAKSTKNLTIHLKSRDLRCQFWHVELHVKFDYSQWRYFSLLSYWRYFKHRVFAISIFWLVGFLLWFVKYFCYKKSAYLLSW